MKKYIISILIGLTFSIQTMDVLRSLPQAYSVEDNLRTYQTRIKAEVARYDLLGTKDKEKDIDTFWAQELMATIRAYKPNHATWILMQRPQLVAQQPPHGHFVSWIDMALAHANNASRAGNTDDAARGDSIADLLLSVPNYTPAHSPLLCACTYNRLVMVKRLVEELGYDVEVKGPLDHQTPLEWANDMRNANSLCAQFILSRSPQSDDPTHTSQPDERTPAQKLGAAIAQTDSQTTMHLLIQHPELITQNQNVEWFAIALQIAQTKNTNDADQLAITLIEHTLALVHQHRHQFQTAPFYTAHVYQRPAVISFLQARQHIPEYTAHFRGTRDPEYPAEWVAQHRAQPEALGTPHRPGTPFWIKAAVVVVGLYACKKLYDWYYSPHTAPEGEETDEPDTLAGTSDKP